MKPTDTRPPLNDKGIKRVQGIVGVLLYLGRAFNNTLLVYLSAIGAQHEAATKETADEIGKLLDYVATYPDDGIIFRKSDMVLVAHADTGFLNK